MVRLQTKPAWSKRNWHKKCHECYSLMAKDSFPWRKKVMRHHTLKNRTVFNWNQFHVPNDVSLEGGTAAFYCLRYRPERAPEGVPSDFFIGKDLAHASALSRKGPGRVEDCMKKLVKKKTRMIVEILMVHPHQVVEILKDWGDELEFYAKLQSAAKKADSWAAFAAMAMSCPGVARLECVNPKSQERSKRQILLLENLRQGNGGGECCHAVVFFGCCKAYNWSLNCRSIKSKKDLCTLKVLISFQALFLDPFPLWQDSIRWDCSTWNWARKPLSLGFCKIMQRSGDSWILGMLQLIDHPNQIWCECMILQV